MTSALEKEHPTVVNEAFAISVVDQAEQHVAGMPEDTQMRALDALLVDVRQIRDFSLYRIGIVSLVGLSHAVT